MRSRSLTSPVRLTSLQISMNWIRACSASARTRIRQRILIQQKLIQKKVQTAQRKKPILNPNDPVQIRYSKSCEDIFLSYPTAVEIRNIAEVFETSA